ncbi:uncharacterized protein LOC131928831 [Physella acuta]|uniref:uncharacterized protein LOC131928831 n=1 Tax=Physella acuta TaxID=109671 RepID=UPI0027DAFE70|nr:uncharacterized protein LOC131928831 [Physella acuta]
MLKIVLALLALVGLCVGDQCADQANACFTDGDSRAISRKMQNYDLEAVCMHYLTSITCANNVQGTCTEKAATIAKANNATSNLCGADGKPDQCGRDFKSCMDQFTSIENDFRAQDAKLACQAINQYDSCTTNLKKNDDCKARIAVVLNAFETTLSGDELLIGCDGECGKAIGNCTSKMLNDLAVQEVVKKNWTDFCIQAYDSVNCLDSLKNTPSSPCAANQTLINQADAGMQSQINYLKDYCDAKGKPSACVSTIILCYADIAGLGPKPTVAQECAASAKFLECSSSLPCVSGLGTTINNLKTQLVNEQEKANCDRIGSCNQRMTACNEFQTQLQSFTSQDANYCNVANKGVLCFDNVRNDVICSKEQTRVSEFETMLAIEIAPACGVHLPSCDDRLKICEDTERILASIDNTTNKADYCKRTFQGIKCFDDIRKNATCKMDQVQVKGWEATLKNVLGPYCGNGGASVHISIALLITTLYLALKAFNLDRS